MLIGQKATNGDAQDYIRNARPNGYNPKMTKPNAIDLPNSPTSNHLSGMKIDQISPELAALIVKKFILPMFESDGKKVLKGATS